MTRRAFLHLTGLAAGTTVGHLYLGSDFLSAQEGVDNPLIVYPDRGWERVYRDQYAYDDSFTFVCAPNDTHMCRLRAFVRNGIVTRIEQNYDGDRYGDPQGNRSTVAWNPRGCAKGLTLHRRVYGPYRARYPMVRAGWKEWADDGFPSLSDDPSLRSRYRFDARGDDTFLRLSWDDVDDYVARGLQAIAATYSGDEGRRRLVVEDGYEPEMLEHWEPGGASCSLGRSRRAIPSVRPSRSGRRPMPPSPPGTARPTTATGRSRSRPSSGWSCRERRCPPSRPAAGRSSSSPRGRPRCGSAPSSASPC
ncbi:MAG: hypothetical protein JJE52_00075 [Acidimicrobiia bacterium]|nr:hypothetical protein [Acidimicrobiia bacterium]